MMVSSTQQQQLQLQRKGKAVAEKGGAAGAAAAEKVVVAVRAATREISKTALMWALTHVVQPGGSILLLVVVPSHSSGIVLFSCVSCIVQFVLFFFFGFVFCTWNIECLCMLLAQLNAYVDFRH